VAELANSGTVESLGAGLRRFPIESVDVLGSGVAEQPKRNSLQSY
jgi:hypothetical protein